MEVNLRHIDSRESILASLKDLASFEELTSLRHKAHYVDDRKMKEWYINGTWLLDCCGNIGLAEEPFNSPRPVLSREEFKEFNNDKSYISFALGQGLAPSHIICDVCGYGWTIENAHDFRTRSTYSEIPVGLYKGESLKEIKEKIHKQPFGFRYIVGDIFNNKHIDTTPDPQEYAPKHVVNKCGVIKTDIDYIVQDGDFVLVQDTKYQHEECYVLNNANKEVKKFKEIFDKAGIPCFLKTIPNEYSNAIYYNPWFEACTPWGKIKIGWRKRVINIKCEDIDFTNLFSNEDTTVDKDCVHAWGWDKAEEYLEKIKDYLITLKETE